MAKPLATWRQGHYQFGDQNTADIKLRLICSDGAEYQGNPLYLHSAVLGKSEFYKTLFSERWSSYKHPFEVEVTCSQSVEKYIKCFELMYSSQAGGTLSFSTVDEALDVLPVASEMLFHAYIDDCMQYLNAVRWTAAQEAQLRALISSLQTIASPELAARLGMSPCSLDCEHLRMLEEFLTETLSMISTGTEKGSTTTEIYIAEYLKETASPSVTEKCKSVLLKEFRSNMNLIKSHNYEKTKMKNVWCVLLWLVRVIQRCDRNLFKTVLEMFCEDSEFRDSLVVTSSTYISFIKSGETILEILINHFMKAMVDGEIITATLFRHSFLTNWIDIMVEVLCLVAKTRSNKIHDFLAELEKGIAGLAETLPLANQKCIYTIWKGTFEKHELNECNAFEWWAKKLHGAINSQHS